MKKEKKDDKVNSQTATAAAEQNNEAETVEEVAEEKAEEQEADPITELQKAFDDLTKAKAEADSQMLRLQAAMIVSGFCTDILPVMDNFRWAVMAMEKDEAAKPHLAGVQMILKQLTDVLAAKGVEQIKTVGEEFDPKYHDAMGQVEVEDESQNNKVLEEITAGYKIGEKVIRAARVKVGAFKGGEAAEE